MRWEDFRRSDNVEDRREDGSSGGFGGRGGIGLGGRGGLGIGTIMILGLVGWALGIDPRLLIGGAEIFSGGRESQQAPQQQRPTGTPADEGGQFAAAILGNLEDVWKGVLPDQMHVNYVNPRLVLFSGATRSRCGEAESAMGPFYCPIDQTVYLDLSFFKDMERRFKAGGDFAHAYVISHEVGHHVQNLLGVLSKVQKAQRETSQVGANQLSVGIELMADCLAGVWANNSNQRWKAIDESEVRDAINAAQAIGDDRLQKASQGYVVPENFTHGSSEQRVRWLMTGLKTGKVEACDTFRSRPN